MGVGRGNDERETDDLLTEQGKRRHAVAGFPEVFDQGEFAVGVGAEQGFVQRERTRGSVEVFGCEIRVGRS